MTSEQIKEMVEEQGYNYLGEEYRIINGIKRRYIKIQCDKGHSAYWVRLDSFKTGCRCNYCQHDKQRFSFEYVKEYIKSFRYELLSNEYKNNNNKLKIKCPKGHIFYMTFAHFKDRGQRCPICNDNKHDFKYIKQYFSNYNYELLSKESEYKNNVSRLKVKCEYGHIYFTTFHRFKNQSCRCPICNISKGEERIIKYLDENNIEYIYDSEYFKDLKGVNEGILRPDFILPNHKIWIEYDGEFHYNKYYEEQKFEILQIHDKLKDEYAKENGWRLIRIPYWDFDKIEEILIKELKINNLKE